LKDLATSGNECSVNGKSLRVLVISLFLVACSEHQDDIRDTDDPPPTVDFQYISVRDGRIRTLHDLRYEIAVTGNFDVTESINRIDQFSGTPYNISLAAFIGDRNALMVHAEKVADSSGASDYSNLPHAKWPDDSFRSSGIICIQIPREEVEQEHDLRWLYENGFEPTGNILFAQFFRTTPDNNTEIVISIMQRVRACDDESANARIIEEMQVKTSVTKLE
jgi:hypothetical protein